jgi:hypothetical protein
LEKRGHCCFFPLNALQCPFAKKDGQAEPEKPHPLKDKRALLSTIYIPALQRVTVTKLLLENLSQSSLVGPSLIKNTSISI